MIINRTYGEHILRTAIGILALVIVMAAYAGVAGAQGPEPTTSLPKLILTLNNTMDGTSPPLVNNITSAMLLDISGNNIATATLPDNMTAQFNLSGINPGDYFIEVNGLAGDHLPTRIDSNASDINQSAGLRLRNSIIGDILNPTYRIKVYPSGNPPVVNSSHPVVNYDTGLNESIYNFVIVPGNTSRIEVRVLNTSEELSNFTPFSNTHPAGANFSSEPFQIWILGDFTNSTGAFTGNHGHLYNNTDSNCNGCHGNLSTKASTFSAITTSNGWCFRCHYGKTGPRNGFVDPRAVVAANGTIAGMVTNTSNGSAISGAIVTANGITATTDASGNYSINITAGTYNITANATGYQINTTGVVVTAGNVTTQDFALIPLVISAPPKVFISYSHDSQEHMDRVLNLCNRLRADGIDCRVDQYETSPIEGWPRWMVNQIEEADFVLVVCTETYERRFEGKETAGIGVAGKWEGAIITQELYTQELKNTNFIPVVFSHNDTAYIPVVLGSATYYDVSTQEGYEALYRRLTNQPLIQKPELGKLRVMPPREDPLERNVSAQPVAMVAANDTIVTAYRSLGSDTTKVETADLLKAADDWSNNIAPPGFTSPITTQQLLILADEWARGG